MGLFFLPHGQKQQQTNKQTKKTTHTHTHSRAKNFFDSERDHTNRLHGKVTGQPNYNNNRLSTELCG